MCRIFEGAILVDQYHNSEQSPVDLTSIGFQYDLLDRQSWKTRCETLRFTVVESGSLQCLGRRIRCLKNLWTEYDRRSLRIVWVRTVPLSLAFKLLISGLDSCFFRLAMERVASWFGSSKLSRLPSLCRLESVDLRRILVGHQRLSYYQGRNISALQVPKTGPDRTQNLRSAWEQFTMFATHP